MARYWVYLNNDVAGPYTVEELIRLRGFSRQTQVRVDDASGKPTDWMSPAEIPELAHIFKAVDDHLASTPEKPAPKAAPKPAPVRPTAKPSTPLVVQSTAPRKSSLWPWILAALILGGAALAWTLFARKKTEAQERQIAKSLVENARLPPGSLYSTVGQYISEKGFNPRWDFEGAEEGIYHVTLSWYEKSSPAVYAFEANIEAQTVRGLNTAASKLLSEGIPAPAAANRKASPAPKKSPQELFNPAINGRKSAIESGDFSSVWKYFSKRKKAEMTKAGMSEEGFVRLQNLTFHVDSPAQQSILKTKEDSDTEMLVLIKQSQAHQPDMYLKQLWVYEDDHWALDDEEKHAMAQPPTETAAPSATPASAAPQKPAPASLPGMSN